jgi:hypothetical protein
LFKTEHPHLKGSTTMGLEDLLGGALGGDAMAKIAAKLGTDEAGAQKAVSAALPALLGKMKANADDPEKGAALAAALQKHDGSALDGGLSDDDETIGQGTKIVGHVFGADADAAQDEVAKTAGIDKGQAAGLLGMLAPMVMGAMGKSGGAAAGPQGLSGMLGGLMGGGGGGGLGGLLGGLLGGGGGGIGQMLGGGGQADGAGGAAGGIVGKVTGMLDQNGDGSIIDDVTRMATGGGTDAAGGAKTGILAKIMGMLGRK